MKHKNSITYLFSNMLVLVTLGITSQMSVAENHYEPIPFSKANIYFELNNTDGDLGIHSLIDGNAWKKLQIEDSNESNLLSIKLKGKLKEQGLTELFFESAEPTFDELSPETFFNRFPEGEYGIEGISTQGQEMESMVIVTHVIPAPPVVYVSGMPVSENCDVDPGPEVDVSFTVSWDPVTESHSEIGRTGELIDVVKYELVLEREEPAPMKLSIDLPPDVTSVALPSGLASPGDSFKVEVLARETSGNQTATESCFLIAE